MSILALSLAGGYLATCGIMFLAQTKLIYYPSKKLKSVAAHWTTLKNEHGKILGFENAHKDYDKTVVVFHGQTHNATYKTYFAKIFNDRTRVIIAEYPGFGHNHHLKISKKHILTHCNELMAYLHKNEPEGHQFILVGESLGSGIAAHIAAEHKAAKLVLITPYSSMADIIANRFWFLPHKILFKHNYDSVSALKNYQGEVLFIVAGKDRVISNRYARKLVNNVHATKHEIFVPEAGHFNWWQHMSAVQKKELFDFYVEGISIKRAEALSEDVLVKTDDVTDVKPKLETSSS